jgi:hypothetical protein
MAANPIHFGITPQKSHKAPNLMFLKTKGAGFNSPFIGHETCCWVHHTVLVMKQYSVFLKSSKFIALTLEIHSSLAHHTRQVSNMVTSEAYLSNLTSHHWKISCQCQSTSHQSIFPKHQSNILSFSVFKVATFPEFSLQYIPTTCRRTCYVIFADITNHVF